jgi:hypothetical protein
MPDGKIENNTVGTPQGGICSPTLANIALHDLDLFLERLKKIVNRGERKKQSRAYGKLHDLRKSMKAKGNTKEANLARREARKVNYFDSQDSSYLRIKYVRYADDFLIGITGPRALADKIRRLIQTFLRIRLKLNLNLDKTQITRAKGKKIPFLGFLIDLSPKMMYESRRRYSGKWRTVKTYREGNIRLLVDTKKVIQRLSTKGFCTLKGDPAPNFNYFQDPQSYTVSKCASILRGINNYYRIADNVRASMARFSYIMTHSLAKMFAAKYKLRTRGNVFALAGKDLSKELKAKKGKTPVGATDAMVSLNSERAGAKLKGALPSMPYTKYKDIGKPDIAPLKKDWKPPSVYALQTNNPLSPKAIDSLHMKDPLHKLNWRAVRGRTALEASCALCAETEGVEMHHIRRLKYLKGKTLVEQRMIAAMRKSIPLCHACHMKAHGWKSNS